MTALTTAGNRNVPRMLGSVTAAWTDPLGSESHTDEPVRGHLAFAQEFVPGVRDGWPLALEAAREGEPFTTLSRVVCSLFQVCSLVGISRRFCAFNRATIKGDADPSASPHAVDASLDGVSALPWHG